MSERRLKCEGEVWGKFGPAFCHRFAWKDGLCKTCHPETAKAREAKQVSALPSPERES